MLFNDHFTRLTSKNNIYVPRILDHNQHFNFISIHIISTGKNRSTRSMSIECQDFERVFESCDENRDGKISCPELRHFVAMVNIGVEINPEEVEAMLKTFDTNGDGFLGFEEFVRLMQGNELEEEKTKEIREAFGVYAKDGCDFITPESLMRVLNQLGESRTIEECTIMIDRFDLNGDGELNFDEFKRMML